MSEVDYDSIIADYADDVSSMQATIDSLERGFKSAKVLLDRAKSRLGPAGIAACTCNVKTDNPIHHDGLCRYRMIRFALDDINSAIEALNH